MDVLDICHGNTTVLLQRTMVLLIVVLLLWLLENVTDSLLNMFGFANELQQANDSLYSNSSLYLLILFLAQD